MIKVKPTFSIAPRKRTLRLGFVPLNDCAPIVVAHENGYFADRGLSVSLHRELGWATVRDKIISRELDAGHALAAMPLAATLGLGSMPVECLTGIVLSLNGNAITLSEHLWRRGVRDGSTLSDEIRRSPDDRTLTFGVVNRFSSHRHLLRKWFRAHRISERSVRLVALPPCQMGANLSRGNLDGFCVGEPWSSVAVKSGSGWVAAISADLDRNHPEKVLMVRADFAENHAAEHLALISALHEACAFCDDPANRGALASMLSAPKYVGATAGSIASGLNGIFHFGHGRSELLKGFCVFHRDGANEPTLERAAWAMELVRHSGDCDAASALNSQLASKIFRSDLFERAVGGNATIANLYDQRDELHVA